MSIEKQYVGVINKMKRFGKTVALTTMLLGYTACGSDIATESKRETLPISAKQTEQTTNEYVRDTIRGIPLSISKHPKTQSSYYKHLDAGGIAIGVYTQDRGLILAKDEALIHSSQRRALPRPHDHSALEYVAIEALINAEMKLNPEVEITLVGKDTKNAFFFNEVIMPSYTVKLYDRQTQTQHIIKNTE